MGWANAEAVLVAYLGEALGGPVVTTELDNDLLENLPVVQVQRVGGSDDGFRVDRALVDVDVYAGAGPSVSAREAAAALAEEVRSALLTGLRGTKTATAVVGRITTVSAPSWRPYENTGLRRCGATYEMFLHPVS